MTADEVKALPLEQKLQIMEALWEDLRDSFDRLEPSPQQKELLDCRGARVRQGAAQLPDWDTVKGRLGGP